MWHSVRVLMGPTNSTLYFDHDNISSVVTTSLTLRSNIFLSGPVFVDEVVLKLDQNIKKCYPAPSSLVSTTFFPESINYPNSLFSPLNQHLSKGIQFDNLPWSTLDISSVFPVSTSIFSATVTLTGAGFALSPYGVCLFNIGMTTLVVAPLDVQLNSVVCHTLLQIGGSVDVSFSNVCGSFDVSCASTASRFTLSSQDMSLSVTPDSDVSVSFLNVSQTMQVSSWIKLIDVASSGPLMSVIFASGSRLDVTFHPSDSCLF
jgi:hypothetical protein